MKSCLAQSWGLQQVFLLSSTSLTFHGFTTAVIIYGTSLFPCLRFYVMKDEFSHQLSCNINLIEVMNNKSLYNKFQLIKVCGCEILLNISGGLNERNSCRLWYGTDWRACRVFGRRVLLEELGLLGQALSVYSSFSHHVCSLIHAGSRECDFSTFFSNCHFHFLHLLPCRPAHPSGTRTQSKLPRPWCSITATEDYCNFKMCLCFERSVQEALIF